MSGAATISNPIIPTSAVLSILTAEFLKPAEIAGLLKVSRKTLAAWRLERQGPPFTLKARGVVVYPAESFKSYLRALPQRDCREGSGARETRWSRASRLRTPPAPVAPWRDFTGMKQK